MLTAWKDRQGKELFSPLCGVEGRNTNTPNPVQTVLRF